MRSSEVRLEEVLDLVKFMYQSGDRRTSLLLGGIGIGKSVGIKDIAKELALKQEKEFVSYTDDWGRWFLEQVNKEIPDVENGEHTWLEKARKTQIAQKYFIFKDIRLTDCEPSDLLGIPRESTGDAVAYMPLLWGRVLSITSGVLFLDELTNVVRPDVQAVMYKLLLDRLVGDIELNKDVMVVAAGNRPEHSSIANELPSPAIDRVDLYDVREASLDEWIDYMDKTYGEWDKRLIAFLKSNLVLFNNPPEESSTLDKFPTPRGWTNLALITDGIKDIEKIKRIAYARVGADAGSKLAASLNAEIIPLKELLAEPSKWEGNKLDAKYLMAINFVSDMVQRIQKNEELDKHFNFIRYLQQNDEDTFVMLMRFVPKTDRLTFYNKITEFDDIRDHIIEVWKRGDLYAQKTE